MQFSQVAAWIAATGFVGMMGFQLLLAAGAPLGHLAWGGQVRRLPSNLRIASLVSAGIFALALVVVLERAGIIALLPWLGAVAVAAWLLVGLFALSTLGNLMSSSPLEKRVMTPIALLLTLACAVVALGM